MSGDGTENKWEVQVGKGKGSYKTKYKFAYRGTSESQAWFWYVSLNVHSGFKKRLLHDGVVVARVLT